MKTALLSLLLPLASVVNAQTTTGSNEWYVVYPDRCAKDCDDPADPDCGGLTTNPETYATVTQCCETKLSWIVTGLCEANSQDAIAEYVGTSEWYANSVEEKCVKDCDPSTGDEECGGIVTNTYTDLFADVTTCCATKLSSLNEDWCVSNSDPTSTGTGLYFPDSTLGYCVLDEDEATCPADTECKRATSQDSDLYDTATECCTSKFSYVTLEICEASGGFTDMWAVDYPNNVCKLDCDPDTAADPTICASPGVTDTLYDTPEECCVDKLGTVQYCAEYSQNVEPTGSLEWYVSHVDGICKKDCPEDPAGDLTCGGLATPDVTTFATEVLCCEGGLASVSSEYCEAMSLATVDWPGTGKYYSDGVNNRCVEDCEVGATSINGGTCGGIISDASVTLHDDSASCCSTELSYLDEDWCVDNSLETPVGTLKYMADTAGFCAQDVEPCDPAVAVCDRATANDKLYADIASCCATMPYITEELCLTRSVIDTYTDLWFVDGNLKCAKDCDVEGGDLACEEIPSMDITLYDSEVICCDENLGSLKDEYCEDISLGVEHMGTETYYTDFFNNRCVADCAEGETAADGGACGGIITDASVPLFTDAVTCCADTLTSVDPAYCADRSLAVPVGTGSYFADSAGFCVMDDVDSSDTTPCDPATLICDAATASDKLYADVATCCATMPYITTELCVTRSAVDTYTDLFFVDTASNCAVDCDPASGPPCAEIPSMDVELFDSEATCCEEKLAFVASEYCEATSRGEDFPGTGEYYTDGTNNRCVADCAEGEVSADGGVCGGIITDASVPTFLDSALCCSSTLSYVDPDFCADRSLDVPVGTSKYIADSAGFCAMDDADLSDTTPCDPASIVCDTATASDKLYDDVATCCASMAWITTELCETRSAVDTYTNLFFVDTTTNCAVDCDPASGAPCAEIPGMDITLFDSEVTCCEEKLGSVAKEYCEALSRGEDFPGTGKYYTDFINNRCVEDCEVGATSINGGTCGGIVMDASVTLYDDAATCCSTTLSTIDPDFCADRSLETPVGTSKYFADSAGFCVLDVEPCDPVTQVCGMATADDMLSVDIATCCADSLPYITTELCESRSDIAVLYTDLWFVDGLMCVQDCDPTAGPPCGEVTDMSIALHDTVDLCCAEKLSFMDSDQCIAISEAGSIEGYEGSSKWHGAAENKCVLDCEEGTADFCGGIVDPNSEQLFDDAASCCAGIYNYVDAELCEALSTDTYTNKFYVDYPSMVCKQHCEETGTPPCGGHPTEITMDIFADLETCCDEKLDWVHYCEEDSMGTEPAGTGEFYIDWARMLCVQDCPEANGAPCGGVAPGWVSTFYSNPDSCCIAHLSEKFNDPEQDCVPV